MQGWNFTVSMFVGANILLYASGGISHALAWKATRDDTAILRIKADEELNEEEKDAEVLFRENEVSLLNSILILVHYVTSRSPIRSTVQALQGVKNS